MGDLYRADELREIAEYTVTSAVAATFHVCSDFVVPANVVRTILRAHYYPDVSETRSVYFAVISRAGVMYAFRNQATYNSALYQLAVLEQGNEIRLLPGEYIRFGRDAATAGSSMLFRCQYVDHIIPFQKFIDPYNPARRKSAFIPRYAGGGGGLAGGGGVAGGGGAEGGGESGGGGGEPVL